MRAKRIIVYLLALTMLVSMAVCTGVSAFADDLKPITMETTDIDNQLAFIQTQISGLKQNDGNTWYYTVTDLDHDGNLELIAASQHPQDRSTNLKVWEVSADRNSLSECSLAKDPEESFPDILTDAADTFHDTASNTWNYLVYDNVVISPTEVYTSKSAFRLKDGVISYDAYAVERTLVVNGMRSVSHTDSSGIAISPEQYNAAGVNAFAGQERSSTNFEWLTADKADSLTNLIDSYAVFSGVKAPSEAFPVPKPAALNAPTAAPAPSAPPAPAQPVYLSITKNPTNENRTEGATALFVSCANTYESLTWTLVSPNGGEYSVAGFRSLFGGASVTGENSTTLSIANVSTAMNNWGAYCTFYYRGQTARTATAFMYISAKAKSAPSGNYSGYVLDWNYSSVTLNVADTVTVTVPQSICVIEGELSVGASASVYWDGQNVTYCYIKGTGYDPGPTYGSMGGTAHEGGGGFAIDLYDGSQVYVDSWKCNVSGYFYDGASCVVYYQDYPSSDNIYSVDISGADYDMNDTDTQYTYGETYVYELHDAYNDDGSSYDTVTCPNCGREVSMAYDSCPYCGFGLWD